MVDIEKMDKSMQEIAVLKNTLSTMGYDNEKYDDVEEELHDKEDDFLEEFGTYLEEVLHNVHDEVAPDTEVLLPIAYMAKVYSISEDGQFDVSHNSGVFVDADDFPGKNTRLVFIPNPVRIVMNVDRENRETLWTSSTD